MESEKTHPEKSDDSRSTRHAVLALSLGAGPALALLRAIVPEACLPIAMLLALLGGASLLILTARDGVDQKFKLALLGAALLQLAIWLVFAGQDSRPPVGLFAFLGLFAYPLAAFLVVVVRTSRLLDPALTLASACLLWGLAALNVSLVMAIHAAV